MTKQKKISHSDWVWNEEPLGRKLSWMKRPVGDEHQFADICSEIDENYETLFQLIGIMLY
jgi:hypothetical protein